MKAKENKTYTLSYYIIDPNHPKYKERVIHTKEFSRLVTNDELNDWANECYKEDGKPRCDYAMLELTSVPSLMINKTEIEKL